MTMPRKPDRFDRIADQQYHHWEAAVTPSRIAELLRREHAAVVRMVKLLDVVLIDWVTGQHLFDKDELLQRLAKRKR